MFILQSQTVNHVSFLVNSWMWNKCIKLLTIVNSVHRGKGRTTRYTLGEAVYWDFASSRKISLWRSLCLCYLRIVVYSDKFNEKTCDLFHCPGSWENLVNVCNTILVSHTVRITIMCRKRKRFYGSIIFAKLFCSFIKKNEFPYFRGLICFHVPLNVVGRVFISGWVNEQ